MNEATFIIMRSQELSKNCHNSGMGLGPMRNCALKWMRLAVRKLLKLNRLTDAKTVKEIHDDLANINDNTFPNFYYEEPIYRENDIEVVWRERAYKNKMRIK